MPNPQKTVLITGCSDGGLGAALAHAFHNTGNWKVIATARNLAKLTTTKSAGMTVLSLDVLDTDSIAKCASEVSILTGGKLDMLINNAGGGYSMPVLDVDLAAARRLYELNVFSLIPVVKAFFTLLRNTAGSKLVVHTSVVSVLSLPLEAIYSSSKAAAASIAEALRVELQPFDIQVIDLKTGMVRSNFFENALSDMAADIPADSVYRVPDLEKYVGREASANRQADKGMTSEVWAKSVVQDLSKAKCPSLIWRGGGATLGRIASHLPVGMLDATAKKETGFDGIEAGIRAGKTHQH